MLYNKSIILFLIIILLVIMRIRKLNEKFNQHFDLVSPIILKGEKKKSEAFIEWYNDDRRIKEFIILYIDVHSENKDIWVQKNIKCDKKRCRIILKNLNGIKYNLTILSTYKSNVSKVRDIITFGDDFTYVGVATTQSPTITATGDNDFSLGGKTTSSNNDNKTKEKTIVGSPTVTSENVSKQTSTHTPTPTPTPSLGPIIDCDGKVISHNITTEDELESAKINYKCNEMSDYNELREHTEKKPFYYYYWESVFG